MHLSINPGEYDIKLNVPFPSEPDLDYSIGFLIMPAPVPEDYLLHEFPLIRVSTDQPVIIRTRVLVLRLKHVQAAICLPSAVVGLIVPELEIKVTWGEGFASGSSRTL